VPDEPLEIVVDGESLWLDPQTCRQARDRARHTGKPHNLARPIFETEIVHALARQVAERIGADPLGGDNLLDEADLAETRRELRREPEVLGTVDWLWPILTPRKLLAGLFASVDRIESAAPALSDAERRLLHRGHTTGWTPADVPLLDEAAELLGELLDDEERIERERVERERRARIAFAEGALEILAGSRSIDVEDEIDPEILMAADVLDAGALGERHEEGEQLTAAQRAAADRKWTFGHVIVDEAQELSPMAWRLLMRRCPSRSMTLVGDVAQTGDLSGTSSWQAVLEPYVGERWRLAELNVNYRTPAEIMSVAAGVLAGIDPALEPPRSVRETGIAPWALRVEPERLAEHVVKAVRDEATEVGEGRLGVLVPAGEVDDLGRIIADGVPEAAIGEQAELDRRVVVLTVRQAKGLEFDSVLVVDPQRIVAESPRGLSDLYVALTRATRRLGVLHTDELPAVLAKGLAG
jgi:DNA helicase IV